MEYLMTYAWALFVVLVVGVTLWRMGIFEIQGGTVTSTGFSKIKPFLSTVDLNNDGNLTVVFMNGAGTTIRITGVDIMNMMGNNSCKGIDGAFHEISTSNMVVVKRGYTFLVRGAHCGTGISGDFYEVNVNIKYNMSLGEVEVQNTDYGQLRGPYTKT